jgi:hypothetical protein
MQFQERFKFRTSTIAKDGSIDTTTLSHPVLLPQRKDNLKPPLQPSRSPLLNLPVTCTPLCFLNL